MREITSCHIENPIVLGENMGDKDCILDISILLNQNRRINLEMQVGNQANWCSPVSGNPHILQRISTLRHENKKNFHWYYSLRVLQLNQLENATEGEKNSELYQWSMFFIAKPPCPHTWHHHK